MSKYSRRESAPPININTGGWTEGESVPFKDEDPSDYKVPMKYTEPTDFELKIAMAAEYIMNENVKLMLDNHIKKVKKIVRGRNVSKKRVD